MIFLKNDMIVDVHFFLRGKETAKPDELCSIYAQIDCDGLRGTAFSIRLQIPAKYWQVKPTPKKSKIKPSTSEHPASSSYLLSEQINEGIARIRKAAQTAKNILESTEQEITPEAIKLIITAKRKVAPGKQFLATLDELRDVLTSKRSKNTMTNYRTRRNNIHEFLLAKNYGNLKVSEFRYSHFEEFQLWMIDQKNDDGSERWGTNTINKHLTLVNQVLEYAINKEYLKSNPIGAMGLEYDRSKPPQYMEADARQRVEECTVKSLEREIDVSIFLMYTGLSHTDYSSLGDEHLYRLPAGEYFIKKPRDKTNIYSIIPLLPQAHAIIKKYGSIRKLPRLDLSDFNKALKILGELTKAPFKLSTSVFRDTFISMMENEMMVPARLIMFMVGHTNERQLSNYSIVHPARILHDLNKNKVVIPFNLEAFEDLIKAS
ncbi:phage integrase SAM-like domain-containing protein [Dyadobacter sp. LHD-138]|uniref:tyrosine-type recombinase/integrase n=1 Tax=Dyadobacter sp. LHD-138 TaxID=3071413 RepID=UPI0027E0A929|nr:phage integrase SAM-like domain-containing protein [Dyadobacter sp. LHD-138]MDQ6479783.1 phage integrase SAM-like domain-containing protein [Dyadobacter sp. LHD-138]